MARRAQRGAAGWSGRQLVAEAGVSRALARTAFDRGYLSPSIPALDDSGAAVLLFEEADIVLLRVAVACLDFPDRTPVPRGTPRSARPRLPRRDDDALHYTRSLLADRRAGQGAAVLLTGREAVVAKSRAEAADALGRLSPSAVLVLPVGVWKGLLPSAVAARAAEAARLAGRTSPLHTPPPAADGAQVAEGAGVRVPAVPRTARTGGRGGRSGQPVPVGELLAGIVPAQAPLPSPAGTGSGAGSEVGPGVSGDPFELDDPFGDLAARGPAAPAQEKAETPVEGTGGDGEPW